MIPLAGRAHPGQGLASAAMQAEDGLLDRLERILGWRPILGTFNVFLPHPAPWDRFHLTGSAGLVRVYRAAVSPRGRDPEANLATIPGALIRSESSGKAAHHLELVAPVNVRETLRLDDRAPVRVWVEEV